MDLGLCLMDTPHPSYPPLDLAASGAVVVTNTHGSKKSLEEWSRNIIAAPPSVSALIDALRDGVKLSREFGTAFRELRNRPHSARVGARTWPRDRADAGRRGLTRVFVGIAPAMDYVDPWLSSLDDRLRQLAAQPRRIAYFYEYPDTSTFRYRVFNPGLTLAANPD